MTAYLQLIVPEQLNKQQYTQWFDCVKESVPSGLLAGTEIELHGEPKQTSYYYKPTVSGKHAYVIPLVRNLDTSEVHVILKSWCETYAEGDFLLDYSQTDQKHMDQTDQVIQLRWREICHAWAKQQHAKWMQKQQDKGWRYGVVMNPQQKTHPWMQPWESLPAEAQDNTLESVKDLLEILDQFGYDVRQKPQA